MFMKQRTILTSNFTMGLAVLTAVIFNHVICHAADDKCALLIGETVNIAEPKSSQFGVLDTTDLDKMLEKYHMFSEDAPAEVIKAFGALYNGHMTLSVFKKIITEYPNLSGSVSAIVYKSRLSELHKKKPSWYSGNGTDLINETMKNFKISSYSIQEAPEYYIIDILINGSKDAELLGALGTTSVMQPQIFLKSMQNPTNHFFKVPDEVFFQVQNKIKTNGSDDRFHFLNMLKAGHMTLDAANALIDFDGASVLSLDFHVSKAQLKLLKSKSPSDFSGDQRDIEYVLNNSELSGKFTKLSETDEMISYKILIESNSDIRRLYRATDFYAIQGRISLD